jgi:CAAX prenyl protease-like protein
MWLRKELSARHPWFPYVAPFALFILLTLAQGSSAEAVVWVYPAKTVVVGLLIWYVMPGLPPLTMKHTGLAVVVGFAVFILWVALEGLYPLLGTSRAFDPFGHLSAGWPYVWIAIRILGTTVVVAVIEEYFWRGFLLRWIINADFQKVAIGTFSWPSFLLTTALFASEHNRWLVGLLAGAAYNLLLYRTRSLYACIIAHGVTNLVLGIYVLTTGQWGFW